MRIKFKYILVCIVFSVMSCGPKKGIVTKKKGSNTRERTIIKEKDKRTKSSERMGVKN